MSSVSGAPRSTLVAALFAGLSDASNESARIDQLVIEMAAAWSGGQRPLAEEYLNRCPELWQQTDLALRLVYEEICLRKELGEPDADTLVAARFPQWSQSLRRLIECHRLLESAPRRAVSVGVGEAVGGFRLLAELGRGAVGGVYLAEQSALSDRPVVLKITPLVGQEHLLLARLQHTHVVPLYSVADDPKRGLRMLCMPYFGGGSAARVLELMADIPPPERSGRDLLAAVDRLQLDSPATCSGTGPTRRFFERASYVEAVCWIGVCIADALQYAHERGLVHFDIKPANILLAADGTPMLLDFHLARPPVPIGAKSVGHLGGTPLYMPPEQVLALTALAERQPVLDSLDGRCDLYSLGLTLMHLLGATGRPDELRQANPAVSVGLADVLSKCVAEKPDRRYPTASALADDLRAHLAHRPLRGVRNRSVVERWRKWKRRRPHAGWVVAGLAVAAAGTIALGSQIRGRYQEAGTALADARSLQMAGDPTRAREAVERGLRAIERLPFADSTRRQLHAERERIQGDEVKSRLHTLADRIRFASVSERLTPTEAEQLETACREIWSIHERLDRTDEAVRQDLFDVVLVGVRVALGDRNTRSREDSLRVLAEAEASLGSNCVLDWERHEQLKALGRPHPVPTGQPRTAWDHLVVGRIHLRAGRFEEADDCFSTSIMMDPANFWAHFYRGHSAHRLRRLDDADRAFSVCIALAPRQAECYLNRGVVRTEQGKRELADQDFATARTCGGPAPIRIHAGTPTDR
jgi:tetratricopeptide (TPR) repeat protein